MYPHEPMHDVPTAPAPVLTDLAVVEEKPTIAKAIIATTGAMSVAIIAALADGRVTTWEIVLGLLAAIGTGAATWSVSNKP